MKRYADLNLKVIRDECGLDFAYHTYNKRQCSCCYGPIDIGRGWAKGKRPVATKVSKSLIKYDRDTDNFTYILFKNAYNGRGYIKSLEQYIEDGTCIEYRFSSEEHKLKVCKMLQEQLGFEYIVEIPQSDKYCIKIKLR